MFPAGSGKKEHYHHDSLMHLDVSKYIHLKLPHSLKGRHDDFLIHFRNSNFEFFLTNLSSYLSPQMLHICLAPTIIVDDYHEKYLFDS